MRKIGRSRRLRFFLVATALIVIFGLVAANAGPKKGDKPSEDWSRSVPLGQDVNGSIGLAVDDSGQQTYLIWSYEGEEGNRFRFVHLNEQGDAVVSNDLQFPGYIRTPRLLPAGEETLHLMWASRVEGGANWQLWHTLLTTNGQPLGQPRLLSPEGSKVGRFVVASTNGHQALVAWDRASQGGLVMRRLDQDGLPLSDAILVSQDGERPSLKVDAKGQAHLAWLRDRSFYYAALQLDDLDLVQGTEVVDFDLGSTLNTSGDILDGPELGYAGEWVYIFSSVVSQSDTETGTGIAEYIAFPSGSPTRLQPERLWALPVEEQPYETFESSLALTQLSHPLSIQEAADEYGEEVDHMSDLHGDWTELVGAASAYMVSPSAMIGRSEAMDDGDVLAAAMAISQDDGLDSQLQIAMLLFAEGRYLGYSIAGRTDGLSDDPVLALGSKGDLHLAWREGARGVGVSYATTAPAARAALDKLTISDFTYLVLQGGLESLVSIMFIPLASWWMVPGLLLMILYARFRRQSTIAEPVSWIPLLVAVAAYVLMKFMFLPTMTTYVPFSAWLQVPGFLEIPFRLGIPLAILLVAILAANKVRVRYSSSAVIFYVALVLTDAVLTLAVYGVNYMGAL